MKNDEYYHALAEDKKTSLTITVNLKRSHRRTVTLRHVHCAAGAVSGVHGVDARCTADT